MDHREEVNLALCANSHRGVVLNGHRRLHRTATFHLSQCGAMLERAKLKFSRASCWDTGPSGQIAVGCLGGGVGVECVWEGGKGGGGDLPVAQGAATECTLGNSACVHV